MECLIHSHFPTKKQPPRNIKTSPFFPHERLPNISNSKNKSYFCSRLRILICLRVFLEFGCFQSQGVFRVRVFLELECFQSQGVLRVRVFLELECFQSKGVFRGLLFLEEGCFQSQGVFRARPLGSFRQYLDFILSNRFLNCYC